MLFMLIYTPYQIIGNTCINDIFIRIRQDINVVLHGTSPWGIATPVCGLARNDILFNLSSLDFDGLTQFGKAAGLAAGDKHLTF